MIEISKPAVTKHWVAKSNEVLHYGITEPDQVTITGLPIFLYFDDEQGLLTELEKEPSRIPTLPTAGELREGEIYSVGSKLYEVRQDHTRTEHDPETVPALFISVRVGTSIEWMTGEKVLKGDRRSHLGQLYEVVQAHVTQIDWAPPNALWQTVTVSTGAWIAREPVTVNLERTYLGKTYICRQAHITQTGWEPPNTPALWSEKVTSSAWGPGQAVKINDVRTHNGSTYRCRQSHTTQIGWEPPNTPALWLKI